MKIPILTYHSLSKVKENDKYTIEEKEFITQLKFLQDNNFKCILVDDYYKSLLESSFNLPGKCVIITFDDGYESDYTIAYPILKKYNFKATFFITTDCIEKAGYMTKRQIKALQNEGMSIQSHAKSHLFLDEMKINDIYQELEQSKNILEGILDKKISFISFPGGRYNKDVLSCAKKINYSALFSSRPFYFKRYSSFYLIGRLMIKQSSAKNYFLKIITMNRIETVKTRVFHIVKYFFKKSFGNNVYHFFWKRFIKGL